MRCDYVDWDHGQLHIREWGRRDTRSSSIVCLPPSPFSGKAFMSLAPLIADQHHVIALDYPGYGGSSAMPHELTMSDMSNAAITIAGALAPGNRLTFLGFHTGAIVAADMAILFPDQVDHLVLIDIPFFDAALRQSEFEEKPSTFPITSDVRVLEDAWKFNVGRRLGVIDLPRAFDNFIDMISSGEGRNAAFRASFQYDCMAAFPNVTRPATCIATAGILHEETKLAAATIPGARLIDLPEISTAALDAGAQRLAEVILKELDRAQSDRPDKLS